MSVRAIAWLSLLAAPAIAHAQPTKAMPAEEPPLEQRAADVVSVLKGERPASDVFTQAFLKEVPPEMLRAIEAQMEAQFGPLRRLEKVVPASDTEPAMLTLRYQRGLASGPIAIEPQQPYKVTGLRIADFQAIDDSADALTATVQALPGDASIYLAPLDGGQPLVSYRADEQFAVGSSFKLYVLSALARSIAAGEHRWSDVVQLSEKSLPSGMLQDWPQDAPITIQTLATLMISISDNTATDQLIRLLGRDRLANELSAAGNADPSRTIPFLTTREMFALKTLDPAQVSRFVGADDEQQALMLDELDLTGVTAETVQRAFAKGPQHLEVEWFASGQDIAALLLRLRECGDPVVLDILGINKSASPAESGRWSYIGYKGGSEPGVLSLNWLLRSRMGRWFVLSMSWNNRKAPVDSGTFEVLAARAMALAPAGEQ